MFVTIGAEFEWTGKHVIELPYLDMTQRSPRALSQEYGAFGILVSSHIYSNKLWYVHALCALVDIMVTIDCFRVEN
jgi:hypothetical protein